MTIIKGTIGEAKVHIDASQCEDDHTFIYFMEAKEATHVPTADLLAALDATANTDVVSRDVHRRQIAAVQEERDEWKVDADEWKARAEKAEAALERVRALFDSDAGYETPEEALDDIRAALNPSTLPTEAGAIIIATEVRGVKGEWVAVLDEEGDWYGPNFDGYHFHKPEHITAWKPASVVAEDAS